KKLSCIPYVRARHYRKFLFYRKCSITFILNILNYLNDQNYNLNLFYLSFYHHKLKIILENFIPLELNQLWESN
ncbi:hypothetical protein C1646_822779, partial [Rhizophagus diaphanus]